VRRSPTTVSARPSATSASAAARYGVTSTE
jgi:hypothetical protein